ncbi:hypothetical protein, partial [Vibrio anguillarum]|uniref:hypothetical protein n=1 Tax=Vibrio anguillarum TaxID=55601 RepID=UPI001F42E12B
MKNHFQIEQTVIIKRHKITFSFIKRIIITMRDLDRTHDFFAWHAFHYTNETLGANPTQAFLN